MLRLHLEGVRGEALSGGENFGAVLVVLHGVLLGERTRLKNNDHHHSARQRFTREELELLPDEVEGIKSGEEDELR